MVSTVAVVVWKSSPDPKTEWFESETLPEAKPVWTDEVLGDELLVADDVLLRSTAREGGDESAPGEEATVTALDLTTGKTLWEYDGTFDELWVSGDRVVIAEPDAREYTVHDLRSGAEVAKIKLDIREYTEIGFRPTVSGDVLVYWLQHADEPVRVVGVDLETGDELWRTDPDVSSAMDTFVEFHEPDGREPKSSDMIDNLHSSVDSAVVILGSSMKLKGARVIDVADGEALWTMPRDPEALNPEADLPGSYPVLVTKSGGIYAEAPPKGQSPGFSYVFDAKTGKSK
ncbi:MAG: PQQ-binding-like beta-propeller repeat protein, partial [Stackebrandtia sp.]